MKEVKSIIETRRTPGPYVNVRDINHPSPSIFAKSASLTKSHCQPLPRVNSNCTPEIRLYVNVASLQAVVVVAITVVEERPASRAAFASALKPKSVKNIYRSIDSRKEPCHTSFAPAIIGAVSLRSGAKKGQFGIPSR